MTGRSHPRGRFALAALGAWLAAGCAPGGTGTAGGGSGGAAAGNGGTTAGAGGAGSTGAAGTSAAGTGTAGSGAIVQPAEAIVNQMTPSTKIRRRPIRSPSEPPSKSSDASVSR